MTTTPAIRRAVLTDLQAIDEIYNQAIQKGFTAHTEPLSKAERKAWFEKHSDPSYPLVVAEMDGKLAGWATLSAYREGRAALKRTAEISYYIHEGYKRKGTGRALIGHLMEVARKNGFATLLAIILENNLASISLIRQCGFTKWGLLPSVAVFEGYTTGHVYYGIQL